MTVKFLTDEHGKVTDVQISLQEYYRLLEKANELPEHVKAGIRRGQEQGRRGETKSTDEVMAKYKGKYGL